MLSSVRLWLGGWRRDYEGWWVRARRAGDSNRLLELLSIHGFVEEVCVAVLNPSDAFKLDKRVPRGFFGLSIYEKSELHHQVYERRKADQAAYDDSISSTLWLHRKRGSKYIVLGYGFFQTIDEDYDGLRIVLYEGLDGKLWARPMTEFLDGRFQCIDGSSDIHTSEVATHPELVDNSVLVNVGESAASAHAPESEPGEKSEGPR